MRDEDGDRVRPALHDGRRERAAITDLLVRRVNTRQEAIQRRCNPVPDDLGERALLGVEVSLGLVDRAEVDAKHGVQRGVVRVKVELAELVLAVAELDGRV